MKPSENEGIQLNEVKKGEEYSFFVCIGMRARKCRFFSNTISQYSNLIGWFRFVCVCVSNTQILILRSQ